MQTYDYRLRLYHSAIDQWGESAQVAMFHEEVGELLMTLGHYLRDRATPEQLADEIADVRVMLEQLVGMVGLRESQVDAAMTAKINRLAGRLGIDLEDPEQVRRDAAVVLGLPSATSTEALLPAALDRINSLTAQNEALSSRLDELLGRMVGAASGELDPEATVTFTNTVGGVTA